MNSFTLAQSIRSIEGFGGVEWANQTTLHPVGLAMTALCGVAAVLAPRRFAVWPFIVMACFVAPAQRLVVAGMDFNLIRLMVLFGFARVVLRADYRGMKWMSADFALIAFALIRTAAYTAQQGTSSALIFQAGQTFDAIGIYFLMRMLIRTPEDIIRVGAGFAVIAIPTLCAFLLERLTGRNIFSVFGGVPEITRVREGRMRCQGAFAHPIIAGCFWAGLLPLVVSMWWWRGPLRALSIIGTLCVTSIVLLSASSTPVMGLIFGALGAGMFVFRRYMRIILLLCVGLIFALHMSMNKPVWHLISRITIARGNTGYHRYQLIDNAIRRFDEWALLGTKSTAHWFWGGQDVTNHYILEAVRGGFASLALFVAIITLAFVGLGRSCRALEHDRPRMIMAWAVGVCLFVHCTNFIGVSYFGQGAFVWYLTLALAVSTAEWSDKSAAAKTQRVAAVRRHALLAQMRRDAPIAFAERSGR